MMLGAPIDEGVFGAPLTSDLLGFLKLEIWRHALAPDNYLIVALIKSTRVFEFLMIASQIIQQVFLYWGYDRPSSVMHFVFQIEIES